MERIQLGDINFKEVWMLKTKYHIESDLYYNYETLYKIFKILPKEKINKKQRKIELLNDGESLPNVVMPISEIFSENIFFGYSMKYIQDSINLYEFNKLSKDINLYFQILSTISNSLVQIHQDPRNIIVGDLNFNNIIIDKNFNPYFVDFDSCKIDGLKNETIPAILKLYIDNRGIKTIDTTQNTDKLSLLLCSLYVIFKKHIDKVSMYEFDGLSEQITTLKNMREIILEIKKYREVPEVPYIHTMIDERDIQQRKTIITIKK